MSEQELDAPEQSPAPAEAQTPPTPTPEQTPEPVKSKWSDTWREDMAGELSATATAEDKEEREKLVKRLQRFNTPADAAKALREQDKLISSGQLKRALPKDAKPEQIAQWRKENGIPETWEKYDLGISQKVELSEVDKSFLEELAKSSHAMNKTPEMLKADANAYIKLRDSLAEKVAQANSAAKASGIETLRSEWGTDYQANLDGVNSLLNNAPSSVSEALIGAIDSNGVQVLNNPAVMQWLSGQARQLGFVGATVLPSGGDVGRSIDERIAEIEQSMFNKDGSRSRDYLQNTRVQAEYARLLDSRNRLEK